MKARDEAFRKVPSNTQQILRDLNIKMDETQQHVASVDAKFVAKVDKIELVDLLNEKLDTEHFVKVFPKSKEPSEHLKQLIKNETTNFNERILNMVKLWDQKISNLRNELNIQAIYKKLKTFTSKEEVEERIKEL